MGWFTFAVLIGYAIVLAAYIVYICTHAADAYSILAVLGYAILVVLHTIEWWRPSWAHSPEPTSHSTNADWESGGASHNPHIKHVHFNPENTYIPIPPRE